MKRPDLAPLACVNPACQRFRLTGQDHIRLLRCRTCGEECSARRGTALCNTKVAAERAASVVEHLGEGWGGGHRTLGPRRQSHGRATAPDGGPPGRAVPGLPRMRRHATRLGMGCTGELRENKPKRGPVEERAEAGDMGDHTALAADSTLLVSLVVGTRTHEPTRAVVHDAKQRLRPGHLPAICTEAYDGKVRKTLAFSKAPRYHRWMSWLSVGLYNFCRGHSSNWLRVLLICLTS
jgi:hypothetical protein